MLAVTTLAARPPALAARLAKPKNRPRRVIGITRPITSIHAGMSTPPTPVTTSSTRSITPSVSAGARSARKNAASASTTNGTRSQTVRRDGHALGLSHEHRRRRRLEDRRTLDLQPGGKRLHAVERRFDPVPQPDATARGGRGPAPTHGARAGRQHRKRADDRHPRVDDDDLLSRRAIGIERFVTPMETLR